MVSWSQACSNQLNRPLWQQKEASYGGNLFAVPKRQRALALLRNERLCVRPPYSCSMQVASFAVTALYSCMWLRRSRKARAEDNFVPWFSGTVCLGSVAGALTWGAALWNNYLDYEAASPGLAVREVFALNARANRWSAVFILLYPWEFMCFSGSKLMLLRRLMGNVTGTLQAEVSDMSGIRRSWVSGRVLPTLSRAMAAAVMMLCVLGMVAFDAAAVYTLQAAELYDQAAAACDIQCSSTNSSLALANEINAIQSKSATAQAVQNCSEALALLLISTAFLIVVVWSVAVFHVAERFAARSLLTSANRRDLQQAASMTTCIAANFMQAAAQHRRRLVAACVIVLVTLPARAAYDFLSAYAAFNEQQNDTCGICDPCQTDRFLINEWLIYTPEFQPIVAALSSPLTLLVSLKVITSAQARGRAIAVDVQRARLVDGM